MASSTPGVTVAVHGPLLRSELAELTARWACELERFDAAVVWVDATGLFADAVAVDARVASPSPCGGVGRGRAYATRRPSWSS